MTVEIRRNLCENPSFEGGVTTGWFVGTGGTPTTTVQSSVGVGGGKCLQMAFTATSSTSNVRTAVAYAEPVAVGAFLAYSIYVWSSTARSVTPAVLWVDNGGVQIALTSGSPVAIAANTWTLISYADDCPASATFGQAYLEFGSVVNGNTVRVDKCIVEKASVAGTYFDGDSPAEPPMISYAWTNADHNIAQSTQLLYESIDLDNPTRKVMWFGTEKKFQAVPAPATGMHLGRSGRYSDTTFDSGARGVYRSHQTAKTLSMDFPVQEATGAAGLDLFEKYASGFYGDNRDYPIWFADPMIFDQNLFPENWASPGLFGVGWDPICKTGPWHYMNAATNPSVEVNATGWNVVAGTSGVATGARVEDGGNAASGSYTYRVTWTTATTAVSGGIRVDAGSVFGAGLGATGSYGAQISVKPSKTQRLQARIRYLDSGNNIVGSDYMGAETVCTGGSWTTLRLQQDGGIPTTATKTEVHVLAVPGTSGSNWAINDTLRGDALMTWEDGAASDTYFDGDTPGALWQSTVGNSRSDWYGVRKAPVIGAPSYNTANGLHPLDATYTPLNQLPPRLGSTSDGSGVPYVVIPIPKGYTLWLGFVGSQTGSGRLSVTSLRDGVEITTIDLVPLSGVGTQMMNTSVIGPNGTNAIDSVKIYMRRNARAAGTVRVQGMMAQLWPDYITPNLSPTFIEGKGYRGMKFTDAAVAESYVMVDPWRNVPVHYKGLSTELTEAQETW